MFSLIFNSENIKFKTIWKRKKKEEEEEEEEEKKENWMIIALTTTIVGTFNVLTGVTKAPCPIKCRCGICAFSWSSLGPTASFRAPSVWSPLWPVTVHWIRFCERKRLKPKYQASLVGLGERRFEVWDLRFEIWGGGGGAGGGGERTELLFPRSLPFLHLSSPQTKLAQAYES